MPSADPEHFTRMGNLLVWFGGGVWRDIADADERSTYQTAGFLVVLNAVITWVVAALAVATIGGVNPLLAVLVTALLALLVGAFGRVLASRIAERSSRLVAGDVARGLIAVLLGLAVGELAALALFTGPINAELNARVDAARAEVSNGQLAGKLAQAEDRRAALDENVTAAIDRRDHARLVARCEYNPTPDCPPEITGDPGNGPQTAEAEAELATAEQDLADARSEREQQAPALDKQVAALDGEVAQEIATAEALARADNGIDARWTAMNTHTADHPVAMVLRLGVDAFFVVLNLLPLLLRLLRGETMQDSRIAARRERLRAEEDAATAIAIKRVEERAAAEDERAAFPVLTATAEWDQETLALPAGSVDTEPSEGDRVESDNLPVLASRSELEPAVHDGELVKPGPFASLPGPLPKVARAVTGMVRPLVPEKVVQSLPSNPVKKVRSLLEEVEEWRFSMTRKRTVTMETEEPAGYPASAADEQRGAPAQLLHSAMATRILQGDGDQPQAIQPGAPAEQWPALSRAEALHANRALPLGDVAPELPAATRRELPPGEGS